MLTKFLILWDDSGLVYLTNFRNPRAKPKQMNLSQYLEKAISYQKKLLILFCTSLLATLKKTNFLN